MSRKESDSEKKRHRLTARLEPRRLRDLFVFGACLIVAAIFWLTVMLNDSTQRSFDVRLKLSNVPDSVTFLNPPPEIIHAGVRDKGSALIKWMWHSTPVLQLNFDDYAADGVVRVTAPDIYTALRTTFGSGAQIATVSIDSLHLFYTTTPGREVPIKVVSNVTTGEGYVLAGPPKLSHSRVLVYSEGYDSDTVKLVKTAPIALRGLTSSRTVDVRLIGPSGMRIIPSTIKVRFDVEPIVKKQSTSVIDVMGVPAHESLLIFPANAEVSYFIPMNKFNDAAPEIRVAVDYADIVRHKGRKLPLKIISVPEGVVNATLLTDSVEYTIVRK